MDAVSIGYRLREARVSNNESSADVCRALNISNSALSMYESGKRIPRDDVKIKLAEHYGCSVASIFFAE